ncbi:MAG: type II secretion system protein M [Blastocatellia bacterium]|nr:type II secretion system protein M [Blastocatellia bacterium]
MKKLLAKLPQASQFDARKTSFLRLQEYAGIGILLILGGIAGYSLTLSAPVHSEVLTLDKKYKETHAETDKLQNEIKKREYETQKVGEALKKLKTFEEDYLRERRAGQLALLDELNELGRKTSVQMSNEITMSEAQEPLPELGKQKGADKISANEKEKFVVFPTVSVKFDISGPYANVRKFIKELERSKQFIILELLEVSQETGNAFKLGGAPTDMVHVDLTLTAFYRREK